MRHVTGKPKKSIVVKHFSLIEVIIAMIVLGIGVFGLYSVIGKARQHAKFSNVRSAIDELLFDTARQYMLIPIDEITASSGFNINISPLRTVSSVTYGGKTAETAVDLSRYTVLDNTSYILEATDHYEIVLNLRLNSGRGPLDNVDRKVVVLRYKDL